MTDPLSDRPAYRQVADRLRLHIDTGEWPVGHKMPSESELMGQFGVSRVTVRLAVGALRSEGLIVTRQGRGSFVRDREPTRRVSSGRYVRDAAYAAGRVAEPATVFGSASGGVSGQHARYRLERSFREERATMHVADLLGVEVGSAVLERRFVFHVDERPEQITTSYLPLHLVRSTPIADPANEPWPGGTIAQLASIGCPVTRVEESVRARMPTPDEAQTLRVAAGVPVLVVTRRMLAGPTRDQPVEVALDIVFPADRVVLDHVIDIDA